MTRPAGVGDSCRLWGLEIGQREGVRWDWRAGWVRESWVYGAEYACIPLGMPGTNPFRTFLMLKFEGQILFSYTIVDSVRGGR